MNIRFEYLYRDAGNFKQWGEVVFANPEQVAATLVAASAASGLLESLYFIADEALVPDLHFDKHIAKLDHDWHEVHGFFETDEPISDPLNRSIGQFVESLGRASD